MTILTVRAAGFAAHKHRDHTRSYTGEPYFVHLRQVADLVQLVGVREEVVAAAYLHDTLEDTACTEQELLDAFGYEVTSMVVALTDHPKEYGNRKVRKAADRIRLAAASAETQTIKLADLISNTASIAEHDPKFAVVYLAEKRALLAVLTAGHPNLMDLAKKSVAVVKSEEVE